MLKWKLVAFPTDEEHNYPTTYSNPEGTIESFKKTVEELVGDPENAKIVWDDLSRVGARYAEWSYVTFVLVSYEI